MLKLAIFCVLFLVTNVKASTATDFQYYLDLKAAIKKNLLYQVPLTTEVLEKCRADYGDIRLYDQGDEEIPYVVIENELPPEKVESYDFQVTDYQTEKNSITITLQSPKEFKPIGLIKLDVADRDFRENVSISGSNDFIKWEQLAKDTIYDFSSQIELRKTEIRFKECKYLYYRLKLTGTQKVEGNFESINLKYKDLILNVDNLKNKKLKINRISGQTAYSKEKTTIYDEKKITNFSLNIDKNGDSVIILEANLPADVIYFDILNSYYCRNLRIFVSNTGEEESYTYLNQTSLYNFPFPESKETKNYIAVETTKHRFYKFVIENKNNPSLEIKNIRFRWIQKNLYFIALNDTPQYQLYFGNETVNSPDYDLKKFVNQNNWFKQDYNRLETGLIVKNAEYRTKSTPLRGEKILLTAIVILLAAGMSWWIYKLLGKA